MPTYNYYNVIDGNYTQFHARAASNKASLVHSGRITSPIQYTLDTLETQDSSHLVHAGDVYNPYAVQHCKFLPHHAFITISNEFLDQAGSVVDSGSQAVYVGDCNPYTEDDPPVS